MLVEWSNLYSIKSLLEFIIFIPIGCYIEIWNLQIFSSWAMESNVEELRLPIWALLVYLIHHWNLWLISVESQSDRYERCSFRNHSRSGCCNILVSCTGIITWSSTLYQSNWYLGNRVIAWVLDFLFKWNFLDD